MELITGGRYQGKREYAVNTLNVPKERIVDDFNETIRDLILAGEDTRGYMDSLLERTDDPVILVDEVGCGIIPLDEKERLYRMTAGRLTCALSKKADHVYRVVAGLGIKLK